MSEAVLDASALLSFLRNEPGADKVAAVLPRACISSVNLAEVLGKLVEYGKQLEDAKYHIGRLRIEVVPFSEEHAHIAASLWKNTRSVGMSLGDRACLALALHSGLPALTTEAKWLECNCGAKVVKIR